MNTPHLAARASLTRRAAFASVGVALLLLLLKAHAAWKTDSVAMLGSLVDTGLDLAASLITLFGVRIAAMPADRDHRFGHGKAEALAALVQVGIVSVSAAAIGWRAVNRLIEHSPTTDAEYGIAVSFIAIVVTLALVTYQRSVVRRTRSVAIGTDQLHYQGDLLLNLSVIAALALDQYLGFTGADPLLGIGIALWLLIGAWRASNQAIDQLMDREWPDERRRHFLEVVSRHPDGLGVHDLRTRTSGAHEFAQFHLWVRRDMSVERAHRIVDELERAVAADFPGVEVLIHIDPEGHVDEPGNWAAEQDVSRKEVT